MQPRYLSAEEVDRIYKDRIAQLEGLHLNAKINRRIEQTFENAGLWELDKGEALIADLHTEHQALMDLLKENQRGDGF